MDGSVQFVGTCRICGAEDWLDVVSFGATPLANGFLRPAETYDDEVAYPLDVGVCRDCGLMSLRHLVNPRILFDDYVYVTSDSRSMVDHMGWVVDLCRQRAGLSAGGLVVEFGSNIGTQLALFQRCGLRAVGVDPAKNLVDIANEHGVETLAAFFDTDSAAAVVDDHGVADLVLGRQTLAHIPDLHGLLDAVDVTLGREGVLAIEVPYLLDLLEQNQFDTIYHEHASYFSLRALCRLFDQHGLRMIDVERVAVHGGSIMVLAARDESSWTTQPSVAHALDVEERRGLSTDLPYLEFAERIQRVARAIATLVRDLVAQGQRVAGYGAPSKGSALLLACGLGAAELDFCSDTTSFKIGTVLPGSHVPVCSPEQARECDPDVYLLLAWSYAEEIIAKEHAFLAGGGRFIIPVPEPRIVGEVTRRAAVAAGPGRCPQAASGGPMEYGAQHAALYDESFRSRGKDYPREAEAVVDMVRERCPGARTLLDVACGTGLHLQTFAQDFDHVEGLELSPDMLAIARTRLPEVPINVGDMRTFDLGRTFDAVTCMSNALAEVATLDGLSAALRRMVAHLVPGGVLVVEPWYFPETYLDGHVGGHVFRDGDRVVSRITHSVRDGTTTRHTVAFMVADPTGITQFKEVCVLGLFTREEYVDALEDAGVIAELVPGFCLADGRPNGPGLFVGTRPSLHRT